MAIGGVVIQFLAKTRDAIRDVDALTSSVKGTGDEAKKTDKSTGSLGRTLKVGLAAGAAFAGAGIAALAGFLIDAAQGAIEDKQSADKLAETLKKIPGITQKAIDANEEWILSMQLATNVADTDLRKAVQTLVLSTNDLKEAQELAALALDVSAQSGKSLETVSAALAKAHAGNTSALKRMYPWLDKNKDGTLTYAEAVEGLGDKYKGAAEKAANNDPWKRLQTIWGELKESLVQFVIPLIGEFGDWFKSKENQQKIKDFIVKMGDLSAVLGGKLVDNLEDFITWLKDPKVQQALKDWATNVGKMASSIGALVGHLKDLKSFTDKLPSNWILRKLGLLPDFGKATDSGAGSWAYTPPSAPPVLVTEDQIYLAIQNLIMRGERRRGGRPMRLLG